MKWLSWPSVSVQDAAERLFWAWALAAGLVAFGAAWMQHRGLWQTLIQGDPSGISLGLLALSVLTTAWCGRRAWVLRQQAQASAAEAPRSWRAAWQADRRQAPDMAASLLSERSHGPHETAWWLAAATIKLGLLGTVVGFIVMATQIGRLPTFDIDQVQTLLQKMTQGMAIALYTTLLGLMANLWLGLQLLLLDRMADRIVADIVAEPLTEPGA